MKRIVRQLAAAVAVVQVCLSPTLVAKTALKKKAKQAQTPSPLGVEVGVEVGKEFTPVPAKLDPVTTARGTYTFTPLLGLQAGAGIGAASGVADPDAGGLGSMVLTPAVKLKGSAVVLYPVSQSSQAAHKAAVVKAKLGPEWTQQKLTLGITGVSWYTGYKQPPEDEKVQAGRETLRLGFKAASGYQVTPTWKYGLGLALYRLNHAGGAGSHITEATLAQISGSFGAFAPYGIVAMSGEAPGIAAPKTPSVTLGAAYTIQ